MFSEVWRRGGQACGVILGPCLEEKRADVRGDFGAVSGRLCVGFGVAKSHRVSSGARFRSD